MVRQAPQVLKALPVPRVLKAQSAHRDPQEISALSVLRVP